MKNNYFSSRFTKIDGRDRVWKAIVEDIARYVPLKGTILDCGTGYGSFINNVTAKSRFAIDITYESKTHLENDVRFFVASVTYMPKIKSTTIDVAFASNLFEHLTEQEVTHACKELQRVLKNNGCLILLQPNFKFSYAEYFDDYTHRSTFSHISLADRLKAEGFDVIRVIPKYLPLTMKSKLPKSFLLTKLYLNLPFKPKAGQMLIIAKKK